MIKLQASKFAKCKKNSLVGVSFLIKMQVEAQHQHQMLIHFHFLLCHLYQNPNFLHHLQCALTYNWTVWWLFAFCQISNVRSCGGALPKISKSNETRIIAQSRIFFLNSDPEQVLFDVKNVPSCTYYLSYVIGMKHFVIFLFTL